MVQPSTNSFGRSGAADRAAHRERGVAARPTALHEHEGPVPRVADARLDRRQPLDVRLEGVGRREKWAGRGLGQTKADVGALETEDPISHLQVGAAEDAAGNAARPKRHRRRRVNGTGSGEDVEILRPVDVAPGAAELAADVDAAPVGDVLRIGHRVCREPIYRVRPDCQPSAFAGAPKASATRCGDQKRRAARCARLIHRLPTVCPVPFALLR